MNDLIIRFAIYSNDAGLLALKIEKKKYSKTYEKYFYENAAFAN